MAAPTELGPPWHASTLPSEAPLVPLPKHELALLERAIRLGRRGWGRVHPNPMVGCVLVRDGEILAEGWHREFGGPHAEVDALERVRGCPGGATAFVSLEPCRHHGRTAACTEELARAGVARVVYGVADPHPAAGGGGDVLRAAGVRVEGPVWPEAAGRRENPVFFHAGLQPFVAIKLALSLDGKIARVPGGPTRLTGPEATVAVHQLRAGFDAVLVGARTVHADDPRLTVREGGIEPRVPPARMVVDPDGSVTGERSLFREPAGRVLVFVASGVDEAVLDRLEGAGADVHRVPRRGRRLALGPVLETAARVGIRSILCEGGGRLANSFLAERRADRLYLFYSPIALGPDAVPGFPGPFPRAIWEQWRLAFPPARLGEDVLCVYDREA